MRLGLLQQAGLLKDQGPRTLHHAARCLVPFSLGGSRGRFQPCESGKLGDPSLLIILTCSLLLL